MSGTVPEDFLYLDYAATTPIAPEVAEAMRRCHEDPLAGGNPSSLHVAGRHAQAIIDRSRAAVAALIGARPRELVFTSGATEADNLALKGAAEFRAHRGRHLVTMATEHKAVLESAAALEQRGFEVTRLEPAADGLLSLAALENALRDDTQLVSVMHVNNETGVVQDIESIGELCRRRGILFHSDAAQSAGKLPLDAGRMPVDLLSLSAHKMHGPQGIGALYVAERPGCGLRPQLHGGAQERRLRAGTEPVALIRGFAVAAELAASRQRTDLEHAGRLGERLWRSLRDVDGIRRNGSVERHYPGILSVSVEDLEGESLLLALEPLCVGSGSACNARSGEASRVLKAMGLSDLQAQATLRFSFGRGTSEADVDRAARRFLDAVARLRPVMAPAGAAA